MKSALPARLAAHLARSVGRMRRHYRRRLNQCQKDFSPHAVHALRVETRRALALLDLLDTLGGARGLRKSRKTFKQRLDAFDGLRDTQVQLELLQPLWRKFPGLKPLKKNLCSREKKLATRLKAEIKPVQQTSLNHRLKSLEQDLIHTAKTKKDPIPLALQSAFTRVLKQRSRVRCDSPPTIHRMRIAFKHFRYLCELLQSFQPAITNERLAAMHDFQTAAGTIQDLETLLKRLERLADKERVSPGKLRLLQAELLRQQQAALNSFLPNLDLVLEFDPAQTQTCSSKLNP